MIFPKDAITITTTITGVDIVPVITEYPNTILGVRIQQSGIQSETLVYCGPTDVIAHNYAKDYPQDLMSYVCNNNIIIDKTGTGDEAFITITYVPYDISKNDNSSTSPYFIYGFSYGEVVLSIFIFMIFILIAFRNFWSAIFHKKITIRRNRGI